MVKGTTRVVPLMYGFATEPQKRKPNEPPKKILDTGNIVVAVLDVVSEVFKWLQLPHVVSAITDIISFFRRLFFAI